MVIGIHNEGQELFEKQDGTLFLSESKNKLLLKFMKNLNVKQLKDLLINEISEEESWKFYEPALEFDYDCP